MLNKAELASMRDQRIHRAKLYHAALRGAMQTGEPRPTWVTHLKWWTLTARRRADTLRRWQALAAGDPVEQWSLTDA